MLLWLCLLLACPFPSSPACAQAVRIEGEALAWASDELQADYSVVMAAVEHRFSNGLRWADKSVFANRDIILAAVRFGHGTQAILYASDELKSDPELVHAAMDVDYLLYTYLTWDQQRTVGPETAERYIRMLIEEREWDRLRMAVAERCPGSVRSIPSDRVAYPAVVFQELAARGWNIHRLPSRCCHCQSCSSQTPPCRRYIPRPIFGCNCCNEWGGPSDGAWWWRDSSVYLYD